MAGTNNGNNPAKGSRIKVEPIRKLKSIKRIKHRLRVENRLRDLCLFTIGINTAYRTCELLSLTVGQVDHLEAGERLEMYQSKNKRLRAVTMNRPCVAAIDEWLAEHPNAHDRNAPLFCSPRKTHKPLTGGFIHAIVKDWCGWEQLRGNYGAHTLRKTWGYHQLRISNAPIPFLMEAYGHATQKQTLDYLCIDADEIRALYTTQEL